MLRALAQDYDPQDAPRADPFPRGLGHRVRPRGAGLVIICPEPLRWRGARERGLEFVARADHKKYTFSRV